MTRTTQHRLVNCLSGQNKILASGEAECHGEAPVEQRRALLCSTLDLPLAHTLAKNGGHWRSRPALSMTGRQQDSKYY